MLLFKDASFSVEKGEIVGLIGANGVGKTTLFNIITGKELPDSGSVLLSSGANVGYLEQHVCADSDKTAYEETLSVFSALFEMETEQKKIEDKLKTENDTIEREKLILRQTELIELYEKQGGLTYVSLTHAVLSGLGFSSEEQNLSIRSLSGGQKSKVGLAKLLLKKPDIMLLDEPTNHLDISSVDWLEKFITGSKITAIVISHDRYFLDKICNKTIEIYTKKLYVTQGNYTKHMALKEERSFAEERHYKNTMNEVRRLEGVIEQQRRWNREKNIKTAESKQKQIDRMLEDLEIPEYERNEIHFDFTPYAESGNEVLKVSNLSKEFSEKTLYRNISFDVFKGDSVFIVGENGIGKTTLIKQILKKGMGIQFGTGVTIGYFDQHQFNLSAGKQIIEEIHDEFPRLTDTEVRSSLAVFGFKGEKVFEKIAVLSGGERAKVALCKLMLKRCNLLLLDEPTNHLDIYSLTALENALQAYTGTLIVVSHDRYFINKLASKIVEMKSEGSSCFRGNYDDYIALKLSGDKSDEGLKGPPRKIGEGGKSYLEQKERRSELTKLKTAQKRKESEISGLEEEIERLKAELEDDSCNSDFERVSKLSDELAQKSDALECALEEWEKISEQISELEG